MPDPKGLQLTLRIKKLMRKHGVEPNVWDLCHIPMSEPVGHPMILDGIACTPDVDRHHTKIRGWCFGFPLPKYCRDVPLLYKHDLRQIAGEIQDLQYDERGGLLIRARVDHPLARRMNAFSIACSVTSYQIINADSRGFCAVIEAAHLDEISLTDVPANPRCLVRSRYPVSPSGQFYDLMIEKVRRLSQIANELKGADHVHG